MTIIAIFAVLSESSAAISLPFLGDEEREIYVWFLISFPFYLLLLFFITLNFNYRSLYAPSDFEKDETFLQVIDKKTRGPAVRSMCNLHPLRGELSECHDTDQTPNTSDPPITNQEQLDSLAQHHISLPLAINELHIIDARTMTEQNQLAASLEQIPLPGKRSSQVVVFLANDASSALLTTEKLSQSKYPKKGKGTTYFIVYKVCMQTVTVLGKF